MRVHPGLKEFGFGAESFLDASTTISMVASDIEIKRGDLRQLAPRKKLLKSCASSSEPLRAFRFLALTAVVSIATKSKGNCDDHYARTN
jgi:hypothetical protein